ncbi:MAG TPA: AAA family ATPase [Dehalococcoidia bacterium]|nr:AAA family ATPase [Dehalococcoidia bacterium]
MTDPPNGTVTLLFTDVESSTQLLRVLGDGYAGVLAGHQRLLRDAILAHRGYEVDTQGDAYFVAFARAIDAIAAAAQAQRAHAAYPWPDGAVVRVRMGVHTGQPLLCDDRYVGLDVHRAARIAAAAHGGQVLLSQATSELVRDDLGEGLDLRSLGEHVLKDFERPEPLYQLIIENLLDLFPPLRGTIGPQIEDSPTSTSARALQFVDRERESETLRARLTAGLAGRGSVVLLAGDAGIGKTRLAEEVAAEARQRGAEVLWGRCWENEGAPPFWPWVEILRGLVRNRPPLVLRAELASGAGLIAELVPELRESASDGLDLPTTPLMTPEEARFQLFDAITTFLTNVARSQPLLLLLDDLHWADKPSLLLLEFLQQHLGDARLLVFGTYRNVDIGPGHPLAEVLPALRRGRGFELVVLKGLEEDAVGDMVASFLEQPMTERAWILARVLQEETEGNPFFVQEELRYLVENERIVQREGIWTSDVTSIAELGLPEAVREVIGRRLSRLSETASRLLPQAAVIGREFEVATLSSLDRVKEAAFDAALDEAELARIIEQVPAHAGRYRFSHALFQETLYAGIPSARRSRLHWQVGEALERRYARYPEPHLSELAYHFVQGWRGREAEKAIDFARRAGEQALVTYAYEDAVRHLETALRLLDSQVAPDTPQRCDLLLKLAEALMRSGGTLRVAEEVAPQAADLAEALGDSERALQACRAGLQALRRYASSSAPLMYGRWLERARPHAKPGSAGRLWLDILLAFPQASEGHGAEIWDARLDNLERARALGDPNLLCLAATCALTPAPPRRWPDQVRLAREFANARWEGVNADERSAFDTYCAAKLLDGGDRQAWTRLHGEMRRRGERLHDPYILFWGFFREHGQLLMDGHLLEALAVQKRMLNETRSAGMQAFGLTNATGPGGRNLLYLGRAAEGGALVEELSGVAGRPPDPHTDLAVLCQAHLNRREAVNAALDWLLTPEGAIAERGIVTIVQYLEAAVLVGHLQAAAVLAETLAPAADAATCRVTYTCAARHLGSAAALLGDRGPALAHFRRALEVSTRIGHRPEIALARLLIAELLLDEDRESTVDGDHSHSEALEHLEFAIAELREMKMQPSLERAAALQRRLLPSMNSPTEDSSR